MISCQTSSFFCQWNVERKSDLFILCCKLAKKGFQLLADSKAHIKVTHGGSTNYSYCGFQVQWFFTKFFQQNLNKLKNRPFLLYPLVVNLHQNESDYQFLIFVAW